MGNKKFLTALVLVLASAVMMTACGQNKSSGNDTNQAANNGQAAASSQIKDLPAALAKKGQAKIKVISKIGGDDFTAQYLAGATKEGKALGFKVDAFAANGDTNKFLDAINQTANESYDGVIISHGDDPATVNAVQKLRDKGIEVVSFDSNDGLSKINGITMTSQDDESMAKSTLDKMSKELGDKANIVYLWVDGFPPMVHRNAVYKDFLNQHPGFKEVERYGVADANTSVETQNAVEAMLAKHPKGTIDAIFATWDAFASGAARALTETGRTEIKIYGIDVSNTDLQLMQQKDSPWVSTAAVDPKMIGTVDVRLLAQKLAGEKTPATYSLSATLIDQKLLQTSKDPVNTGTLANIVPGWGVTNAFDENWMQELRKANSK